jgi:hypothetical protein
MLPLGLALKVSLHPVTMSATVHIFQIFARASQTECGMLGKNTHDCSHVYRWQLH